ncbi:MAG: hypothetical protein K2G21_03120 [Muribaculaceae bacterium]|nr:hypothetical protein [Muribaculaceae bacterium]
MNGKDIVGYKYFGFGGLKKATKGLKPFAGTKKGDNTCLNIFLKPLTDKEFKINIMLDGPWENAAWNGRKIGEIAIPANSPAEVTRFTADVSKIVDRLDKKHAIYLVADGDDRQPVCLLKGLGFSKKGKTMEFPKAPKVSICVNDKALEMPSAPVRMTHENGYTGYDHYEVFYYYDKSQDITPSVTATCDNPDVKIEITQPTANGDKATVRFNYHNIVKTYEVKPRS